MRRLGGPGQLEPFPPPLHPLPHHRHGFFEVRLPRGVGRIAGGDEDAKRLGRVPGRLFLSAGRRRPGCQQGEND